MSIICDVNKNGTSIWDSTQANRVTIADGDNTGSQTSFDTSSISSGDYLTVDVDSVGTGTPGAKLVIRVTIEKT